MKTYKDYIKNIKNINVAADYGRMHGDLDIRISGANTVVRRTEFAFAGALAALVLVAGLYFGNMANLGGGNDLNDYVFQQDNFGNDAVMGYVYGEQ